MPPSQTGLDSRSFESITRYVTWRTTVLVSRANAHAGPRMRLSTYLVRTVLYAQMPHGLGSWHTARVYCTHDLSLPYGGYLLWTGVVGVAAVAAAAAVAGMAAVLVSVLALQ